MIDIIQISHNLENAGFSRDEAEAITQSVAQIIAELATKSDLALTKSELREEIANVRTEIAKVKSDLIYWIIGSVGLSTLLQLAASFLRK